MSKKYKLIILPEAQQGIRNIILYIAIELASPYTALNLQDSFEEAINSLSTMPHRYKIIDEEPWKSKGIRRFQVKSYFIYYLISESDNSVKIIAVIYVRRNQEEQLLLREEIDR